MSKFQNSRYYFCQLKEDFFKSHPHDVLRGMEGGREALLLYVELLLESAGHDGHLLFSEHMPFTPELIAAKFQTPIEIVKRSLELLGMLELVIKTESGELILPKFAKYVGSRTNMADYMAAREESKVDGGKGEDKRGINKDKNFINSTEYRVQSTEKKEQHPQPPNKKEPKAKSTSTASPRGSVGDGVPSDIAYRPTVEEITKVCRSMLSVHPDHVDGFSRYVVEEGILPDHRPGSIRMYLAPVYRRWVAKGGADKQRHRLTREELDAVVSSVNGSRDEKITEAQKVKFWDFLVMTDWKQSGGEEITKYNVRHTLCAWLEHHVERDAGDGSGEGEETDAEALRRLEREREDRMMRED